MTMKIAERRGDYVEVVAMHHHGSFLEPVVEAVVETLAEARDYINANLSHIPADRITVHEVTVYGVSSSS